MDSPLLSVIIPVFNAQEVLATAVESVLSQGVDAIEVILVNDGSRDGSLVICQEYAQKDPRFKVIDQVNAGPGAARNAGLSCARGKYISFVDSDDTLQPGTLLNLLHVVQTDQTDLVIAHFNILLNNKTLDRGFIKDDRVLDRAAFFDALAQRPGSYYYSALWNKLYDSQIIRDHRISFDRSFPWGEDFDFNMQYYRYINTVSFFKEPVYNYKRAYSGQTWRTMFEVGSNVLIKKRLYMSLKSLYSHAGLLAKYKAHIYRYIFNITISI